MIITPELIEKAARAVDARLMKHGLNGGELARAAIEAILPDIVEEIAKIVERLPNNVGDEGGPEWASKYDAADAIRSLARADKER